MLGIFIFLLCLVILFAEQASAHTIRVGKRQAVHSIQEALDAARDGDTVLVEKDVYKEKNITISKAVVLKGINYPVLDGEKKYEVISVRSSNATVDGFIIQHSGASG